MRHLVYVAVVGVGLLQRTQERERRQHVRALVFRRVGFVRRMMPRRSLGQLLHGRLRRCGASLHLRKFRRLLFGALGLLGGLLFGAYASLLLLALSPSLLARLDCCKVLLALFVVIAVVLCSARDAPRHRPAGQGGEERGNVAYADSPDKRPAQQHQHQDRRAEVAHERREASRHDEIPDDAAGVCEVQGPRGMRNGSAASDGLQQRRDGRDEHAEPEFAAPRAHASP